MNDNQSINNRISFRPYDLDIRPSTCEETRNSTEFKSSNSTNQLPFISTSSGNVNNTTSSPFQVTEPPHNIVKQGPSYSYVNSREFCNNSFEPSKENTTESNNNLNCVNSVRKSAVQQNSFSVESLINNKEYQEGSNNEIPSSQNTIHNTKNINNSNETNATSFNVVNLINLVNKTNDDRESFMEEVCNKLKDYSRQQSKQEQLNNREESNINELATQNKEDRSEANDQISRIIEDDTSSVVNNIQNNTYQAETSTNKQPSTSIGDNSNIYNFTDSRSKSVNSQISNESVNKSDELKETQDKDTKSNTCSQNQDAHDTEQMPSNIVDINNKEIYQQSGLTSLSNIIDKDQSFLNTSNNSINKDSCTVETLNEDLNEVNFTSVACKDSTLPHNDNTSNNDGVLHRPYASDDSDVGHNCDKSIDDIGLVSKSDTLIDVHHKQHTSNSNVGNMVHTDASINDSDVVNTVASNKDSDMVHTDASNNDSNVVLTDALDKDSDVIHTGESNNDTDIVNTDASNNNTDMVQTDEPNNKDMVQTDESNNKDMVHELENLCNDEMTQKPNILNDKACLDHKTGTSVDDQNMANNSENDVNSMDTINTDNSPVKSIKHIEEDNPLVNTSDKINNKLSIPAKHNLSEDKVHDTTNKINDCNDESENSIKETTPTNKPQEIRSKRQSTDEDYAESIEAAIKAGVEISNKNKLDKELSDKYEGNNDFEAINKLLKDTSGTYNMKMIPQQSFEKINFQYPFVKDGAITVKGLGNVENIKGKSGKKFKANQSSKTVSSELNSPNSLVTRKSPRKPNAVNYSPFEKIKYQREKYSRSSKDKSLPFDASSPKNPKELQQFLLDVKKFVDIDKYLDYLYGSDSEKDTDTLPSNQMTNDIDQLINATKISHKRFKADHSPDSASCSKSLETLSKKLNDSNGVAKFNGCTVTFKKASSTNQLDDSIIDPSDQQKNISCPLSLTTDQLHEQLNTLSSLSSISLGKKLNGSENESLNSMREKVDSTLKQLHQGNNKWYELSHASTPTKKDHQSMPVEKYPSWKSKNFSNLLPSAQQNNQRSTSPDQLMVSDFLDLEIKEDTLHEIGFSESSDDYSDDSEGDEVVKKKEKPLDDNDEHLECEICNHIAKDEIGLAHHMLIHAPLFPFNCDICNFNCETETALSFHRKTHREPYVCSYCDYECTSRLSLKLHVSYHSGEQPIACDKCDFKTLKKSIMNVHVTTHGDDRPFKCSHCDYRAKIKFLLDRHMTIHSGVKPFQCNLCDYKCARSSNLKQHMNVHNDDKHLKCRLCEYRCNQKAKLMRHIQAHSHDRPYKCDKCKFRCSQKVSLDKHMLKHKMERRSLACQYCDFTFKTNGALTSHLKTHNMDRPYKCNVCSYTCTQKGYLSSHMSTHRKSFKCTYCSYMCVKQSTLQKHLNNHKLK